jgi:hypothetical protein
VRDAERGEYFDPDTDLTKVAGIPRAGILPPGDLLPVDPIPASPEIRARARALREYWRQRNGRGIAALTGDAAKGGRAASLEESTRLRGADGVPAGLARCEACGEWKGECLDTQPRLEPWLVRVHCACENRNRCAGCGEPLAPWKLNGNEYCEADGKVWHYGGAMALAHRCD